MKLVIKGEVNLPVIGEAVTKALESVAYDHDRFSIRGATIYFNFYDRETGGLVTFETNGEPIENVVFETPLEKERKKQLGIARKSKIKRIGA